MKETRQALDALMAMTELFTRRDVPDRPHCLTLPEFSSQQEPLPSGDRLEALRKEIQVLTELGGGMSLPARTLREAHYVLWDREPQAAGFPGVLDAYVEKASGRARWILNLVEAWLRDFAPNRIRHAESGATVARLVRDTRDPRLEPWDLAHRLYAVFDAAKGPKTLASALLSGPGELEEIRSCARMDDALRAQGGFFRATVRALLAALPDALCNPAAAQSWTRAEAVLESRRCGIDARGAAASSPTLIFPDMASEVIKACLSAWLRPTPPKAAPLEAIKAFLIRTIGDPRLLPQRWQGAPEDCTRLMLGWLASDSLEAFLNLIAEQNNDPQWQYRRAFWRACLRKMPKDRPGEVWVVLGPTLAAHARVVKELAGSYGRMEATGQYGDQAVLLLRLGNIILSEWSNVGSVRAWGQESRTAPALYRPLYQVSELRANSLSFPDHPTLGKGGTINEKGLWHRSPQTGLWQGCAAAFLRDRIGLTLLPRDYMEI